jgi:peptide/nickel transport system permease protein
MLTQELDQLTPAAVVELDEIKARGYWEQVWRRFRRDRVAIASFFVIILIVLVAFPGAWIAQKLLGHGPNDLFLSGEHAGVDERLVPVGPMSWADKPDGSQTLFILGGDGTLGRDLFLRLLYGARVSREVAVFSTVGVMVVGTLLGAIAGFYPAGSTR